MSIAKLSILAFAALLASSSMGAAQLIEVRGSMDVDRNLAMLPGVTAFASGVHDNARDPKHQTSHIHDGRYGNSYSWIGQYDPSYVGYDFGRSLTISSVAFGRDNLGDYYQDRWQGLYKVQVTDSLNPITASDWQTVLSLDYLASMGSDGPERHHYAIAPINARGLRLWIDSYVTNVCIDELEVYGDPINGRNNLARETGATAFADSEYYNGNYASHQVEHLNDGRYGNSNSWIGNELSSAPRFAGIALAQAAWVDGVALGRDAYGIYEDRWQGLYQIQYTDAIDPTTTHDWTTVMSLNYDTMFNSTSGPQRHVWDFDAVYATAMRIYIEGNPGVCIDELEIFEATSPRPSPVPAPLALILAGPLMLVTWSRRCC